MRAPSSVTGASVWGATLPGPADKGEGEWGCGAPTSRPAPAPGRAGWGMIDGSAPHGRRTHPEAAVTVCWYVEFESAGPFGAEATEKYAGLAADIATEEGLISKTWIEAPERGRSGGVYLFETAADAQRYAAKHTKRLAGFGITGITSTLWGVNAALSAAATPSH